MRRGSYDNNMFDQYISQLSPDDLASLDYGDAWTRYRDSGDFNQPPPTDSGTGVSASSVTPSPSNNAPGGGQLGGLRRRGGGGPGSSPGRPSGGGQGGGNNGGNTGSSNMSLQDKIMALLSGDASNNASSGDSGYSPENQRRKKFLGKNMMSALGDSSGGGDNTSGYSSGGDINIDYPTKGEGMSGSMPQSMQQQGGSEGFQARNELEKALLESLGQSDPAMAEIMGATEFGLYSNPAEAQSPGVNYAPIPLEFKARLQDQIGAQRALTDQRVERGALANKLLHHLMRRYM